jgi:hypothetical protein
MMPYNLLLLPVMAGYFLLVYSVLFKYNTQRFLQNRLLFESVFVGVAIVFFGFILRTVIEILRPDWIEWSLNRLKVFPINKVDYFWTVLFSSLLAIIFVPLSNFILRKIWRKSTPIARAVDKNGDEIEKLFKRSFDEGVLIQVTLKNNKVYIGFSEMIPEPQKTNYLTITPIISGYRESETKKLIITTDYFKVIDDYIRSLAPDKQIISLNTDIILRQDEILTAGIYEQEIFDKFNTQSIDEKSKDIKSSLLDFAINFLQSLK